MLEQIVIRYLSAHRRLVVPQLGAFLVKTPERSVVFSELLRADDGVLRGLLEGAGMSPLEAAGTIDRFVFEVRHAVQAGERYVLAGFGTLYPGPNGTVAFDYDPQPVAAAEGSEPNAAAPRRPSSVEPGKAAAPGSKTEPSLTPSPKLNPEPCVRGLRYGKPVRTTDAYTYVDRTPRRGFDKWLLMALAAAVIAVAAIVYGYLREADAQADEAAIEWPAAAQPVPVRPADPLPATSDQP